MANQVPPIKLNLKLEGLEGLEKLKGSFRELSKVTNLSDKDIGKVRDSLFEFAKKAGDTERANKGLTDAIKGLLGEAQKGGLVWQRLNSDLTKLQQQSRLTDSQINTLRESIVYEANTHKQSAASIREHIKSLQDLRSQAVLGGQVAQKLSENIQTLSQKMQEGEGANRDHFKSLTQILAVKPDAVLRQWRAYTEVLSDTRATAEQAATAQERLNRLAGAPRIAARRAIGARAEIQADPEYLRRFGIDGRSLEEMPNITAAFSQRLKELQEDLSFTERNTEIYIATSLRMLGVQRELAAATQGLGAALVQQLRSGDLVPSQKNLQEVIGQLKREMLDLDTTTTEGARAYAENANQARVLEQQLKELAGAYRHVGDMATQAATAQASEATARVTANYLNRGMVRAQEQALAELGERVRAGVAATPLALPAAGQTTAAGTGQEISGGARRLTGQTEFTFGEAQFRNPRAIEFMGRQGLPSAATGVSGATGLSDPEAAYRAQANAARVAAIDLSQYRAAIDNAARANNGSVNSVGKLRDAIIALRNQLSPADADFNRLTKRIQELDAQSERLQVRQGRRRMTGMQMTQAAGAALSGGIFGGPEGFLGGAIGGAFGVGGAFAGAAFGAQIGGLRKQLGEFADYAARIQKMEIALRNAAGGQDQFNQAMAAATSATQNLNVPQDIAIQGMTKLTAAVKGAGGQVSDAELVFRNVTSAIKATGGSAQDVDGAITAMVQVFSKGKVSAEELSGQLGERLPGAVTKFAKANDMTLPELQKALEQGQVGLNELMNFIVQLGDEYSGVAEKIAGSSQDAGARLTIAFNEMKIAVGEALQPIGAQFQEAFIPFIENITPALVNLLPKIGEFALSVAKNLDVLAAAAGGAALAMGALSIASIKVAGTAGLSLLGVAMMKAASAAGALTVALKASSVAALLNPWVALAAGIAAATVALIKHNQAQQEYNNLLDNGAGSTDELRLKQRELEADIAATRKALEGNADGMGATGRQAMQLKMKIADLENQLARINKTFTIRLKLEREGFSFDEEGMMKEFTVAGIVYGGPKGARAVPLRRVDGTPLNGRTQFENLAGTGSGSTAKSAADKAAREAQGRFDEELQKLLQAEDFALKKFALEEKISLEQEKQGAIQAGTLESEMQLKEIANQRLDLDIRANAVDSQREKLDRLREEGLAKGLDIQKVDKQIQENKLEDLRIQLGYQENSTQEIKAQFDLEKERQSLNRALNQELEDRRYELGLITKEEYNRLRVERERRRLEEAYRGLPDAGPRVQEGVDLFEREIDPTFAQGLQSQLAIVRRELDDLTKPINQVVGAANAIGDAFSQSFASVINGSATTQEALASFFQNLANYFLDMAAQIIQKMIVMAILNQIVGLLPGGGFNLGPASAGQGVSYGGGAATDAFKTGTSGIGGNYFPTSTPFKPFAMGGIVNKPTLFKYADGGTGRFGLMGEAGPEAIIPLKRGRDGRLGVSGGGGVNVGEINITVQNTGENLTPAAQKQLASQVRGIVLATLVNEQRSGGVLR